MTCNSDTADSNSSGQLSMRLIVIDKIIIMIFNNTYVNIFDNKCVNIIIISNALLNITTGQRGRGGRRRLDGAGGRRGRRHAGLDHNDNIYI